MNRECAYSMVLRGLSSAIIIVLSALNNATKRTYELSSLCSAIDRFHPPRGLIPNNARSFTILFLLVSSFLSLINIRPVTPDRINNQFVKTLSRLVNYSSQFQSQGGGRGEGVPIDNVIAVKWAKTRICTGRK